jgi:hypothetical protein
MYLDSSMLNLWVARIREGASVWVSVCIVSSRGYFLGGVVRLGSDVEFQ